MSEFFDSIENFEKKPVEKKSIIKDEEEETEDRTPNFVKKNMQLQEEIFELEESVSNSKKIDEFVKELPKKYKIILKKGTPANLANFLKKVVSSTRNTALKGKIKKHFEKFPETNERNTDEEETIVIKKKITISDPETDLEKEIHKIVTKSTVRKVEDLMALAEKPAPLAHQLSIYFTILELRFSEKGRKSFQYMLQGLKLLSEIFQKSEQAAESLIFKGVDLKVTFKTKIHLYLEYMLDIVDEKELPHLESLLMTLRPYHPIYLDKAISFLRFYRKKEPCETNDPVFKLTYLLRSIPKTTYQECKDYYEQNIALYNIEDTFYSYIVNEMGVVSMKNQDYMFAFQILQRCFFGGTLNNSILEATRKHLLVLTIILDDKVVDEPFYDVFISNMSILEAQPRLLPSSSDHKFEIYRAYFFLENGCYQECYHILKDLHKIDSSLYYVFQERALKKLNNCLKNI